MTNADRIRQKSDEELAAWLEGLVQIVANGGRDAFDQPWIEWLKEDVKERYYDPPQKTNAQKFEEVFGWPQSDIDSIKYVQAWWNEPYKEPGGRNDGIDSERKG